MKEGSLSQHSYPTLPQRRSGGRRLPPTPRNPSTLNFGVVGAVVMATQRAPHSPTSAHLGIPNVLFKKKIIMWTNRRHTTKFHNDET